MSFGSGGFGGFGSTNNQQQSTGFGGFGNSNNTSTGMSYFPLLQTRHRAQDSLSRTGRAGTRTNTSLTRPPCRIRCDEQYWWLRKHPEHDGRWSLRRRWLDWFRKYWRYVAMLFWIVPWPSLAVSLFDCLLSHLHLRPLGFHVSWLFKVP
jgi:hypothetical protein